MARRRGGVDIVWLAWFTESISKWERQPEESYLLDARSPTPVPSPRRENSKGKERDNGKGKHKEQNGGTLSNQSTTGRIPIILGTQDDIATSVSVVSSATASSSTSALFDEELDLESEMDGVEESVVDPDPDAEIDLDADLEDDMEDDVDGEPDSELRPIAENTWADANDEVDAYLNESDSESADSEVGFDDPDDIIVAEEVERGSESGRYASFLSSVSFY